MEARLVDPRVCRPSEPSSPRRVLHSSSIVCGLWRMRPAGQRCRAVASLQVAPPLQVLAGTSASANTRAGKQLFCILQLLLSDVTSLHCCFFGYV
uniref:Uncharacterized protein n=1 Tax=Setaria viridis TaxID=4556 RepID=A0A4U6UM36_SETVI|nr:hypothetical protein SEVIR_5G369900v2 [Setaria viridis]